MLQMHTQSKVLQIVGPITSTSSISPSSPPFQLPSDWVSELRPRKDGRFDKYYYEPGTGRKFRSLSSIQKYLSGDIDDLPKRLKRRGRENMAIVPCIFTRNPSFTLPDGWVVEQKPRYNSHVVDKYYYEPGTGRKFRSLSSVHNYLSGHMAIAPSLFKRNPSFRLPKGWVVEKKLRNNINYGHRVDRTYIEPGTGKRFRSLLAVERHIAESKVHAATLRPHQLYLTDTAGASSTPLDLGKPPAKIKWVLSPVGSIWKPFVNDTLVPDSLKRKWSRASAHILSSGH